MKRLILAAILLPSVLLAQTPPGQPQDQESRDAVMAKALKTRNAILAAQQPSRPADGTLSDNYQVTLTVTEKDAQPIEVSLVVASPAFGTVLNNPGQTLTFNGTVTVEDSGILLAYQLGCTNSTSPENQQVRASQSSGSVRLKLGEEVQILRAGSRTARLSIKKLEPAKPE